MASEWGISLVTFVMKETLEQAAVEAESTDADTAYRIREMALKLDSSDVRDAVARAQTYLDQPIEEKCGPIHIVGGKVV